MSHFNAVMDFIDQRAVIRRLLLLWLVWMTTTTLLWTLEFAWVSTRNGTEVAAIIAAVLAPYMALQAGALAWYFKART